MESTPGWYTSSSKLSTLRHELPPGLPQIETPECEHVFHTQCLEDYLQTRCVLEQHERCPTCSKRLLSWNDTHEDMILYLRDIPVEVFHRRARKDIKRRLAEQNSDEVTPFQEGQVPPEMANQISQAILNPVGVNFRLFEEAKMHGLNDEALHLAIRYLILEKSTCEHFSITTCVRFAGNTRGFFEDQVDQLDPGITEAEHQILRDYDFDLMYETPFQKLFKLERPRKLLSVKVIVWDDKRIKKGELVLELNGSQHLKKSYRFLLGCMDENRNRMSTFEAVEGARVEAQPHCTLVTVGPESVESFGNTWSTRDRLIVQEFGMGSLVDCVVDCENRTRTVVFRDDSGWSLEIQAQFAEGEQVPSVEP